MKVQILSRKLITPSSPTPEHLRLLQLSYLDQVAHTFYVPRLFCYLPSEEEERGGLGNSQKSELLQNSLSETLTLYYPLAGRYIKEKHSVECNDRGAEYLEARVSGCASLSQLLSSQERSQLLSKWFHQLVPDPPESDTTPLVMVQFNMFECGGVVIAICVKHTVADGVSCFTFINTWGKISRVGAVNEQFRPSFELASFFPPREVYLPQKSNGPGDDKKFFVKRLVFSAAAISTLKGIATSTGSTDSESLKHQPTRVEVLMAFIWMCLIRMAKARCAGFRPSLLLISVNIRNRTILPIPENSFGNIVVQAVARFFPDGKGKLELHDLAGKIHHAIRSTLSNCAKATNADDIVSLVNKANEELQLAKDTPDVDCYASTSWCRFPIYEADHGWGKPSWVSVPMFPNMRDVIVLMDTKDGDGVEALVALDERSIMHFFEQDPEILPFLGQELQA
ncbi:hypothetical protein Tsubulata_036627 [Turnera subulata]|uniref:Uncharacterized protein n=1 Tax=Turnera subulata TaxID=218843 RepID=A0A9Q0G8G3_9ROSI|nr:hypothetical protein Tsubulata_036627 [Turnera subulata]